MNTHAIERIVYKSPTLGVGLFRCRPWYPSFEDTGPISACLIVFPRTSVCITHEGGRPIVADPNVVMFYNKHQVYRRSKLSDRGDLCEFFAFDPQAVIDAVSPFDRQATERSDRPFRLTHGPSDPQCYLLQRQVVDHLLHAEQPDQLYVEETMLAVLGRVVGQAYRLQRGQPEAMSDRSGRELVETIKALLVTQFHEQVSLEQIAGELHTSPYHLCRIFRRQTGSTIHHYLNQTRLRTALEYVAQGDIDLSTVGVTLGYSSHSHFTQAFRRAFGIVPSEFRRQAAVATVHKLSKILIA
jgi:AraC-like DNA-binding protein